MKVTFLPLIMATLVFLCAGKDTVQASAGAPLLTQEEACDLVYAALHGQKALKLPGFGLDEYSDVHFPRFYGFEGTWDNPSGSVVTDHYAVDSQTGDVWSATVCSEYKSRHLRKLQRLLRKRHGISERDYQRIRVLGPMCDPGEQPTSS